MNTLNNSHGFWLHLRQLLCLMLTICMVLIGFPIQGAAQEEGTSRMLASEGVAIESRTTPGLLREPEPLEDCTQYSKSIENLERMQANPVQRDAREKARALIEAAKQSRRDAYERATQQAVNELTGMLKDLAVNKAKMLTSNKVLRQRLRDLQRRGISKAQKAEWLKANQNLNKLVENVDKLGDELNKVADVSNDSQNLLLQLQKPQDLSRSLQQELFDLNRQFVESGMAKDVGLALSGLLGPAGQISFQLANLAIVAGVDALEGAMISLKDLPTYENNLATMEFQHRKIPMDIEIAQRHFKECQKKLEARNSMSKPTTPPPPPPSPSESTASKSSGPGMGTALAVGLGLAGAAAVAVGVGSMPASGGGSSGNNCGSAPIGFGNNWWYNEYSPWCICMGGSPQIGTTSCDF
jgi:hypothetical protein